MIRRFRSLPLALVLALAAGAGCAEEFYFSGYVYDGVTNERLKDYTIALETFDRVGDGVVDERGRYAVGPAVSRADFTIRIEAEGYRSFLSHNQRAGLSLDMFSSSRHVDAFLYPVGLTAPKARFEIFSAIRAERPSGTLRMTPTNHGVMTTMQVGGVDGQIWSNDDDLQFRTITKKFTDGVVEIAEGELVYGVTYQVVIFGVPEHAPLGEPYQAGIEGDRGFIITRPDFARVQVAWVNTSPGVPVPTGELVVVLNEAVEFDPLSDLAGMRRAIDDGLQISSPDLNGNGTVNALKAPGTGLDLTRGTTLTLDRNTLRFTWNRDGALETSDNADPILGVRWDNLGAIRLRRISPVAQAADTVDLATLLGSSSVDVVMMR